MRLTLFALGCMTFLLMGCATGGGPSGVRGKAATHYGQDIGPTRHLFPVQELGPTAASNPRPQLAAQTGKRSLVPSPT
jgi:hypothetical protein